jgi:hypothetical protein
LPVNHAKAVKDFRRREKTVDEHAAPAKYRKLRKANADSLPDWLRAFMPESFPLEFSPDHIEMLGLMQETIVDGGMYAVAMPRGSGKTTSSLGAATWGILEGHVKYLVLVGSDTKSAGEMLDFIKTQLMHNERLQKAYAPVTGWMEVVEDENGDHDFKHTGYLSAGEGQALKYKVQLRPDGRRAHVEWSKSPPKIVLPWLNADTIKKHNIKCSGAVVEARGLTGGLRGMKHVWPDGTVIRPDMVIGDDPQTRESAHSLTQTKTRMGIMRGDLMGLAGPDKAIRVIVPCTVICEGDLADQLLDRTENPEFRGIKKQLVYEWPDEQDGLWQQYAEIYKECKREGLSTERATKFYADNLEQMNKGAVVAWESRKEPKQLSALQYAQDKLITMGEAAFYAEMQNDPRASQPTIYELSADKVSKQLNRLPQYEFGADTHFAAAMIDINMYGLHWVAVSTPSDFCGNIAGWGKFPGGSKRLFYPDRRDGVTEEQAIWNGLNELIDALIACPWTRNGERVHLDAVTIDCGYQMDTVFRFCKHKAREGVPFKLIPSRGNASKSYRQTRVVGRPGTGYHVTQFSGRGNVLVHNTDFWRMQSQKMFLLPAGAPGSLSIYGADHMKQRELADHICAERLVEYYKGATQDLYAWVMPPGRRNDLLDALVGAVVACHYMGARPAGIPQEVIKRAPRRRNRTSVTKI